MIGVLDNENDSLRAQLQDLQLANLKTEAKWTAILCNRIVLETSLRHHFLKNNTSGRFTLTLALEAFVKEHVLRDNHIDWSKACPLGRDMITAGAVPDGGLKHELAGLPHKLSSVFHYLPEASMCGLCCGGGEPERSALALVLYHLSSLDCLQYLVTMIDRNIQVK